MKRIIKRFFTCLILFLIGGLHSILNAQQILVSPDPLYFGITPDGSNTYRDLVVYNLSGEELNISQITFEGTNASEFSIVDDPGSLNISSFGNTMLTIKFHPQSVGAKQVQLVFESNSPDSPDIFDFNASASRISGQITFEKILGTLENDGASDVRLTADGGFIICGNTFNDDEGAGDAYLVKTNSYGEIVWTEVYDFDDNKDNSDDFSSIIPVSDGYIVVGSTDNGTRDLDVWVVKTNLDGVKQWDYIFGGTSDDGASMIEATNDGNFIIAGYSFTSEETGRDGYLLKIDANGTELWSKTIGGSGSENFSCVKQTDDNGYILSGTISTGGLGSDMYLVKTNVSGEVSWSEQFGGPGEENVEGASSVAIASDGGYILTGSKATAVIATDVYVIKTDANGVKDETWGDKTFGEAHRDGGSEVIATSDGGYLIVGKIENFYKEAQNDWFSDVFIIKLDQDGAFVWDNVYGGNDNESASTVRELSDGTFVIIGNSDSYGSRDNDIYFLRLNNEGNIITAIDNISAIKPGSMELAQNYPNPFNGSTTISYNLLKNSIVQLKVYDSNGRIVNTLVDDFQKSGLYKISFDATSLASGLYLYQLITESYSETKKLLLIK